jgi:type VII secretion integral membrane protein EccD
MTLPLPSSAFSSLPDPEPEPDVEPELSRVTVVVGGQQLDVGLPSDVNIAALVDDVIDLANSQPTAQLDGVDAKFGATKGQWTLARLGAESLDPHRSLAEFNVCDGEVLVIREIGIPCAPMLFDDLDVDNETVDDDVRHGWHEWARNAPIIGCFSVGLIVSVTAALLLTRLANRPLAIPVVAAALTLGTASTIAACIVGYRASASPVWSRTWSRASPWLAAVAIPLVFAGSLRIVPSGGPDQPLSRSLPMAFGLTGLATLVTLLVARRNRSFYTAVIGLSVLGTATTVSMVLWSPALRAVGALLAVASVIVIYLAPRVTIVLSKLPVPSVPTAGEPLDDIETQGGTTVEGVNAVGRQVIPTEEGMIERVRPSNQYLTGIVAAATVTAVVGSYLAIDVSNGFFWQGTAFAIAVACVLCLRGRSHYDLVQSAMLIGGGLLTGLALIVKTAAHLSNWQVNAALALAIVIVLIVACGLIAPRLEFSPVMKRQVEILEYIAIALLFPLCFWIIRLYAVFRELRL